MDVASSVAGTGWTWPLTPLAFCNPQPLQIICSTMRGTHKGSFSVLTHRLLLLVAQVCRQGVERIGPAVVHVLITRMSGESAQMEVHLGAVTVFSEG